MCTVSFITTPNGVTITSNRDENVKRPKAIAPQIYSIEGKKIIFPMDKKARGTWFSANTDGTIIVLLNGAEEKHISLGNYAKSRGTIVVEMAASTNPIDYWNEISLITIEPFTLVVYFEKKLYQLRWNSILKTTVQFDEKKSYIWSSATLYTKKIREERTQWFFDFLNENETPSPEDILNFHLNKKKENTEYGLQIKRANGMQTVSSTQAIVTNNEIQTIYHDLAENTSTTNAVTLH